MKFIENPEVPTEDKMTKSFLDTHIDISKFPQSFEEHVKSSEFKQVAEVFLSKQPTQ